MKYDWYHGNISEEQADRKIDKRFNNFLVRHSENKLILSYRAQGQKSHDIIHRSPEGYRLEGKEKVFKTVHDMIEHYAQSPIKWGQVLGAAAEKSLSGIAKYIIT